MSSIFALTRTVSESTEPVLAVNDLQLCPNDNLVWAYRILLPLGFLVRPPALFSPTDPMPVAITIRVVAVIVVVACKRRRRLAARSLKKPVLKQLSISDSKALSKSAAESSLLKPGMLGDSNDASLGSSSDKKSEQSSAKSGSKHRKAGSKRHRSKPAPAVKEVPLLGEEAPEPRPDAHKKGKHRHRRPQGGVSGEAKATLDLHLQEIGKGVGLTPMKLGEGVRSEE